jgi:two-component system, NtrC family, sensor kinase
VHRCKRIIDGLLDFSRPKGMVREVVDINDVVERTLFLLKHHARFKKLRVNEEFDRRMPARLLGNPEQLIQVFMALLINAMDAMGDAGAITIRTRPGFPPSEGIVAEVIDEGPGIARSEMGKIFEPFYTTKPPGRGTGLGLSICYGIVADHGGRIEVESAPGKGSTFRILLPDASE